jgi:REP element-mobilizing transposase RayT
MARRFTPPAGTITHVTVRCNNKEHLLQPERHHNAIISWLNCLPYFFSVQLHHLIIMSNHLHMLVTPQYDNLGQAMSYLLTNLAKYLNFVSDRNNHVFGDRYHPTVIKNEKHLQNVIRYLYQNSLHAGLTDDVAAYPYSSYGCYCGSQSYGVNVCPDPYTAALLQLGPVGLELWRQPIDAPLHEHELSQIAESLKRREFKFTVQQLRELEDQESSLVL